MPAATYRLSVGDYRRGLLGLIAVAAVVSPIGSAVAFEPVMCGEQVATIIGTGGPDVLSGSDGPDVIAGLGGDDVLIGLDGDDYLCGGGGNDVLRPRLGADHVFGGPGTDTVSYIDSARAFVDLGAGTASSGGVRDALFSIENAVGSPRDDELRGNAGPNRIEGGAGNDLIDPRGGDDVIIGGLHKDTVSYEKAPLPVVIDVVLGSVVAEGTDTIEGVEGFIGTAFGDTFQGDDGPNTFEGGDGDDVIEGGMGNDILDGGLGNDFISGGSGRDTISGGKGRDYVLGGPGEDWMTGSVVPTGVVEDTVSWEDSPRGMVIDMRAGTATVVGGTVTDRFRAFQVVVGTDRADVITAPVDTQYRQHLLVGGGGNDVLVGYDQRDQLLPGPGDDEVSGVKGGVVDYQDATQAVTVDLKAGTATGMGTDTLVGLDGAIGSPFDDVLSGVGLVTDVVMDGLGGNDTVRGTNYPDEMFGGEGTDRMYGYGGDDKLQGDAGSDWADAGTGSDKCWGIESRVSCEYSYADPKILAPSPRPVLLAWVGPVRRVLRFTS
jgi:Ca2+-binding RTX toxin-like protein